MNCVNAYPQLLRCEATAGTPRRNWIKVRTVGTKSNRSGIGARVTVKAQTQPGKPLVQVEEVRSGGSYYSQNDLRIHFGLDAATEADVEIAWPSGTKDLLKALPANHLYVVGEGGKILKTMAMTGPVSNAPTDRKPHG